MYNSIENASGGLHREIDHFSPENYNSLLNGTFRSVWPEISAYINEVREFGVSTAPLEPIVEYMRVFSRLAKLGRIFLDTSVSRQIAMFLPGSLAEDLLSMSILSTQAPLDRDLTLFDIALQRKYGMKIVPAGNIFNLDEDRLRLQMIYVVPSESRSRIITSGLPFLMPIIDNFTRSPDLSEKMLAPILSMHQATQTLERTNLSIRILDENRNKNAYPLSFESTQTAENFAKTIQLAATLFTKYDPRLETEESLLQFPIDPRWFLVLKHAQEPMISLEKLEERLFKRVYRMNVGVTFTDDSSRDLLQIDEEWADIRRVRFDRFYDDVTRRIQPTHSISAGELFFGKKFQGDSMTGVARIAAYLAEQDLLQMKSDLYSAYDSITNMGFDSSATHVVALALKLHLMGLSGLVLGKMRTIENLLERT